MLEDSNDGVRCKRYSISADYDLTADHKLNADLNEKMGACYRSAT